MIAHPSYIAVTAATVAMPASADGIHSASQHLVALALFLAERDRKGRWRFARRVHAIPAGEPESALLEWAASATDPDTLPPPAEIAAEIVDSLETALEKFRLVAAKLQPSA